MYFLSFRYRTACGAYFPGFRGGTPAPLRRDGYRKDSRFPSLCQTMPFLFSGQPKATVCPIPFYSRAAVSATVLTVRRNCAEAVGNQCNLLGIPFLPTANTVFSVPLSASSIINLPGSVGTMNLLSASRDGLTFISPVFATLPSSFRLKTTRRISRLPQRHTGVFTPNKCPVVIILPFAIGVQCFFKRQYPRVVGFLSLFILSDDRLFPVFG